MDWRSCDTSVSSRREIVRDLDHFLKNKLLHGIVIAATLVYFVGLLWYVHRRPVNWDEGYYATAARLVWEGKIPYRDFYYSQTPLLPLLYSWVWAVQPRSLIAMRMFSAAFGTFAILMWGIGLVSIKRLPAKLVLATFAVILLNPYWMSWNVVVKTYAVCTLLISIGMICVYFALHSERVRGYFIAGAAFGLSASIRGLYGPLIPLALVWLFSIESKTWKWPFRRTLALLGGAACCPWP